MREGRLSDIVTHTYTTETPTFRRTSHMRLSDDIAISPLRRRDAQRTICCTGVAGRLASTVRCTSNH
jgi:hypothetical protein